MPPLCRDELLAHRPRLIARADQRHRAGGFSPRQSLVPEVLADDTLAHAEQQLGGSTTLLPGGLATWLDANLEHLITERWNKAVGEYTDVMTARARAGLLQYPALASRLSPEDVVGDAWCKAGQFPFRGTTEGHYYAWLLELTKTALIDSVRRHIGAKKRSLNGEQERPSEPDDSADPFERAVKVLYQSTPSAKSRREEFMVKLLAAIERMPTDDRTVAVRTLNGEGPSEIAVALGWTAQRVQGALTRILRRVRALLSDDSHPGDE